MTRQNSIQLSLEWMRRSPISADLASANLSQSDRATLEKPKKYFRGVAQIRTGNSFVILVNDSEDLSLSNRRQDACATDHRRRFSPSAASCTWSA